MLRPGSQDRNPHASSRLKPLKQQGQHCVFRAVAFLGRRDVARGTGRIAGLLDSRFKAYRNKSLSLAVNCRL